MSCISLATTKVLLLLILLVFLDSHSYILNLSSFNDILAANPHEISVQPTHILRGHRLNTPLSPGSLLIQLLIRRPLLSIKSYIYGGHHLVIIAISSIILLKKDII